MLRVCGERCGHCKIPSGAELWLLPAMIYLKAARFLGTIVRCIGI
jgi:hypothetical protein